MPVSFLSDVDLTLIGADAITSAGIINKIGTLGLAAYNYKLKKPTYALGSNIKFLPKNFKLKIHLKKNPKEIISSKILNVTEPTLAEWREQGIGPDFIVLSHNTVKYSLDAIMDYVRNNKVFDIPLEDNQKPVKRPN